MSPRPVVLALTGLPGAGKTTLCDALSLKLGWRVVSRDVVRRALFNPCTFTHIEKDVAFSALCLAIEANALLRVSTIIDGMPFSRVGELERVQAMAESSNAVFASYLLDVPIDVAAERVESDRGVGSREVAPDRTRYLVHEVASRMRPFPNSTVVLNACHPPHLLLDELLRDLKQRQMLAAGPTASASEEESSQ